MPDIPRFYTALAEWLACMIFILPLKKRMAKKTIPLMAGALVVQSVFLVVTGNLIIYFWIPCMINLQHVDGIQDGCATVKGEQLVLSRARKKEFMEELTKYWGEIVK